MTGRSSWTQLVRLRPAPHCRTPILAYSLKISPEQHFLNWQQDPQSNWLARIVVPEKTDHLTVTVDLTAELNVINPFDFFWSRKPRSFRSPTRPKCWKTSNLLSEGEGRPRFQAYLAAVPRLEKPTTGFLFDLNAQLQRDINYLIRMEPGIQTPDQTLETRAGSCRDSAWLLVQLLRHLGIAARFASGYLIQLKADQKSLDGPSGAEQDFTDLHAWCEVYLPGAGWVGLDPTSGLFAGEGHIPLACAANPTHAAPISGALEDCEVTFEFEMSIKRVVEPPRVTKPYSDTQWRAIDKLGDRIDTLLKDGDVRLTMGGEPTFVSIDGHGRRRMDHGGGGTRQARAGRHADPSAPRPLRAGRLPALRPGQVVSRREPAALGLRPLLARRRRALVARPGAHRA
ncbi:MAG: transglutaminase family protein [Rhizomicrobium sp.]